MQAHRRKHCCERLGRLEDGASTVADAGDRHELVFREAFGLGVLRVRVGPRHPPLDVGSVDGADRRHHLGGMVVVRSARMGWILGVGPR